MFSLSVWLFKMRIALCDLDFALLKNVKKAIYAYAELHKIDTVVDCYNSGEKLLDSGIKYNIIFIGDELCGISSMETAQSIRQNDSFVAIVFMSKTTDFILESFKVSPYRFLLKPIEENVIFETLKEYLTEIGIDFSFHIKSGYDNLILNAEEIYYLEADNKHCRVHLQNEILPCNKTMARIHNHLPKRGFSKINRAYVVNLNLVKKYNNEQLCLKNGTTLKISRNYLKSFKQELLDFIQPRQV